MKTVMRYSIMRLIWEISVHERQLKKLRKGHTLLDGRTSEINRLNHAVALCKRYLGEEVINRFKDEKFEGQITADSHADIKFTI